MNSQNQNLNFSGVTAQQTTNPHSAQHKSPLVANPVLEEIHGTQLPGVAVLSDHQKQGMTQYRESREGGRNPVVMTPVGGGQGLVRVGGPRTVSCPSHTDTTL